MSKDQLGDRRKAVEESFFARQNEALRQPLRESEETKRKKQALSAASGVTDDGLLDRLVARRARLGIRTRACLKCGRLRHASNRSSTRPAMLASPTFAKEGVKSTDYALV